jgi:hypothetical protein
MIVCFLVNIVISIVIAAILGALILGGGFAMM